MQFKTSNFVPGGEFRDIVTHEEPRPPVDSPLAHFYQLRAGKCARLHVERARQEMTEECVNTQCSFQLPN